MYIQNVKYIKPTFNLPDVSDCFIQGGTPGTTHNAGLPDITGSLRGSSGDTSVFTGAFKWLSNLGGVAGGGWSSAASVDFAASYSNSVYGNSTTVQPKSVEMKYCIKY